MKDYKAFDKSIEVKVEVEYEDFKSIPERDFFIWDYNIKIINKGNKPVTLLNRSWKIIDENGVIQKVEGKGVIGQQPVINPGENFEYSSSVHMKSPSGFMMGSYDMVSNYDGNHIDVEIPTFSLDSPHSDSVLH